MTPNSRHLLGETSCNLKGFVLFYLIIITNVILNDSHQIYITVGMINLCEKHVLSYYNRLLLVIINLPVALNYQLKNYFVYFDCSSITIWNNHSKFLFDVFTVSYQNFKKEPLGWDFGVCFIIENYITKRTITMPMYTLRAVSRCGWLYSDRVHLLNIE